MSNSGGYAFPRTHSGDRFYNPPPVRRHQQLLLQQQQQQQLQRQQSQYNQQYQSSHQQIQQQQAHRDAMKSEQGEAEARTDSDESTMSRSSREVVVTNIDRVIESVTPFVPAQYSSEQRTRGWRMREPDIHPFFCLGDLWESFREWSAYGLEVPLLLNGKNLVKQYYVPSLSGIQLYIDPQKLKRYGEENDAKCSRKTSSTGTNTEAERQTECASDLDSTRENTMNSNSQRMSHLSLQEKPLITSFGDEAGMCNSRGLLAFEYLEREQPHIRQPLFDKISVLASRFPELKIYMSCDLLPTSWISVAWYPIYRIPMGETLQTLDTSFLTFHSLSTPSRSKGRSQFHGSSTKISIPVFGLASYKLKGSLLADSGSHEWQQTNSLLQAAGSWLHFLQAGPHQFWVEWI